MKFVSWNIGGGPGSTNKRLDRAWHYLAALQPDVALVQEARRLPDWFDDAYQVFAEEPGVGAKRKGKGSLVLVKKEIPARRLPLWKHHKWLEYLEGHVITAELAPEAGHKMVVASVYAPPDKVRPEHKAPLTESELESMRLTPLGKSKKKIHVWYCDFVFFALERALRGKRFIVGGDWNTSRLFDDFPQWESTGTAFFVRAREHKWVDCHAFLGKQEERTYLKRGTGEYQLDHFFCDRKTSKSALKSCDVWQGRLVSSLSDHAPLVAKFDLA